jgi:hypothetical protein
MKKSKTQIEFEDTRHSVEELGPNWRTVLNFWLFLDNLSEVWLILEIKNLLS